MEKLAVVLAIAFAATGCELYLDDSSSLPDATDAIVSDPDRVIGTWQRGQQTFEFTATDYLLVGSDAAAPLEVLRVSVAFGRPDRLVFTDDRCGDDLGTYHWQILRGTLSLAAVDDPCTARRALLVGDYVDRVKYEPVLPDNHALSALDRAVWHADRVAKRPQTSCDSCTERIVLSAWRRGQRMLVTERVVAELEGQVVETCEMSSDLSLTPMRSFDPTTQIASRSVVVESDCATPVGIDFDMGWTLDASNAQVRTWPLYMGHVEPLDTDAVATYEPAVRAANASNPLSH